MRKLKCIIGVAALLLATVSLKAQCSPEPPTLWGFTRIDGYVCQVMLAAPAGLKVEYQLTPRRVAYLDSAKAWKVLPKWRIDGTVYGPVLPPFRRGKFTLWARVSNETCESKIVRWNL